MLKRKALLGVSEPLCAFERCFQHSRSSEFTKVLIASSNLLEGTLPNLVKPNLRALYLSGIAGYSGGSLWGPPKGHLCFEKAGRPPYVRLRDVRGHVAEGV